MTREKKYWHALSTDVLFEAFKTSTSGLSESSVIQHEKKYGPNALPKGKQVYWWEVVVRQIMSPMIAILCIAAFVSFWLGDMAGVWVISFAVVLNTAIGFTQEWKANRAMSKLQEMVPMFAHVRREDRVVEIPARDVVPGDILLLHTGDRITADARLLEVVDLHVNEAPLTGESMPVKKQTGELQEGLLLADRVNMVYASTSVLSGHAVALVVQTGQETEFGKIAQLLSETEEEGTPLQKEFSRLARVIAWTVFVLVSVLFIVGVILGKDFFEMFELSVALAVAAIPDGLIVGLTLILAIGMQRIMKRGALVRRLVAAETLGSVSVICSDKTGTLTKGEMRVVTIATLDRCVNMDAFDQLPVSLLNRLSDVAHFCNDVEVVERKDGSFEVKGNPTDRALYFAVDALNGMVPRAQEFHERVGEIPFDSSYKYMVTRHAWNRETRLFVKGAPDRLLSFFSHAFEEKKPVAFGEKQKEAYEKQLHHLTRQGLRVVALGYRETGLEEKTISDNDLHHFVFLGFMGLRDPIREEARDQIIAAKKAGVRPFIVTGDHPETAKMIAKEAGISVGDDGVITGKELDSWSDEEWKKQLHHYSVVARAEPRHKIRLIQVFQSLGEVVAMTGDGVNDSPALKAADVGIAVGSGTEVAKMTADVVLLDDNLGTITAAIDEGRVIFENIRKVTTYLIAGSFTEIGLIGGSLLLGLPIPLTSVQILWINLMADSLPSAGLAFEPGESDRMHIPPRSRHEPVLNHQSTKMIACIAIATNAVLFGLYAWLVSSGVDLVKVRTMLFMAVGLDTLLFVFAVRSFRTSLFRMNPFSNKWLLLAVMIGFLFMVGISELPIFQGLLNIVPLEPKDWTLLVLIGIAKMLLIEGLKILFVFNQKKLSL